MALVPRYSFLVSPSPSTLPLSFHFPLLSPFSLSQLKPLTRSHFSGNEPSFATPFLYNYLPRRQSKSVLRARQIINQYYSTSPSGLPGNSDAGALDSWLIWNFLGLYPVVTQPIYLLLSPWFTDLRLTVGDDSATLRITAEGMGEESFYVQSVKINGEVWNQSWISHSDIENGGTIAFVLGSEPAEWDTGAVPPSPGHLGI